MWLKGLVSELLGLEVKATLLYDSQSAIHLSKNQAHHERTKHIDVRLHFIREMIENKSILLSKVAGENNAADIYESSSSSQASALFEDSSIGTRR